MNTCRTYPPIDAEPLSPSRSLSRDDGVEAGTLPVRPDKPHRRGDRRRRHLHRLRPHGRPCRPVLDRPLGGGRGLRRGDRSGLRLLQLLCSPRRRTVRIRLGSVRRLLRISCRLEHVDRRTPRAPGLCHRVRQLSCGAHPPRPGCRGRRKSDLRRSVDARQHRRGPGGRTVERRSHAHQTLPAPPPHRSGVLRPHRPAGDVPRELHPVAPPRAAERGPCAGPGLLGVCRVRDGNVPGQ